MTSHTDRTSDHLRWAPYSGATFIGIDGARSGWVVAMFSQGALTLELYSTISEVFIPPPSRVLIDMPIGLPSFARRICDAQARQLLGSRRATIFPVPAREAIYADSYAQCCEINLRHQLCKVSKQAWNLSTKIRELDQFLNADRSKHEYIAEGHPELAFRALSNSSSEIPSKRTLKGMQTRREILLGMNACIDDLVSIFLHEHKSGVDITDAFDAIALCMVLVRSQGRVSFVGDKRLDDCGAPQRICVG